MRAIAAAAVFASAVIAAGTHAEPNKVQYELQERCGMTAALAFKNDHPDGAIINTKDGQTLARYENHYDFRLNKCFSLYTITIMAYKAEPKHTTTSLTLFDVNENKEYGNFFARSIDNAPFLCKIRDKLCRSEDEWRELAKAYMED